MLKRIKIITDFHDHNGNSRTGEDFDALVIKDQFGSMNASFDVGADYSFGLSNIVDQDPCFEIIGDIGNAEQDKELKALSDYVDSYRTDEDEGRHCASMAIDLLEQYSKEVIKADEEVASLLDQQKNYKIERGAIQDGYGIVPLAFLDNELAKEFESESEKVINRHELIAMCSSAQMEINKGDTSAKSLNVKLYMAMREFVEDEMDALIEAGRDQA